MTEKTENDPSAESEKPMVQEQAEQAPSISLSPDARLISAPAPHFDDKFQDKAFLFDDTFYRTRVQKSLHWSIIWSDLMMSMFILFLAMYAYQMAHQEFLAKKTPEIVGGSTTDAMDINAPANNASLPFQPINKGLPLITAGTIKKVESVTGDAMTPAEEKKISRFDVLDKPLDKPIKLDKPAITDTGTPVPPVPVASEPKAKPPAPFDAIYDLSQQALTKNNLKDFASIDLVPDTTMRIILTGDLLFDTGRADLSQQAKQSLQKVVNAIKKTPYMINVIGHTDNLPMNSERFSTNWELSVARASRVARFLIEEAGMNPNQFVVSGYSSFRPIKPNTNVENRALNRRVEIVISKKLPPAEPANPENLKDL
jgi:chemotaxis protein MotB